MILFVNRLLFSSSHIRALSCLSIIFQFAFFLANFSPRYLCYMHPGYLFVTDTLSTPTTDLPNPFNEVTGSFNSDYFCDLVV